jgi:hypothetical protein
MQVGKRGRWVVVPPVTPHQRRNREDDAKREGMNMRVLNYAAQIEQKMLAASLAAKKGS